MPWDAEIWAPCRLGEEFTLLDLGHEKKQYLYAIGTDFMGGHGDAVCVTHPGELEEEHPKNARVGAGPRPWQCGWTYAPKICITPPTWCWDFCDDVRFGLDIQPIKRDGTRRQVKLNQVQIYNGRPVYRMTAIMPSGSELLYFDTVPALDPYFAPIWPTSLGDHPQEPAPGAPVGVKFSPIPGDTRPQWLQARHSPGETIEYIYPPEHLDHQTEQTAGEAEQITQEAEQTTQEAHPAAGGERNQAEAPKEEWGRPPRWPNKPPGQEWGQDSFGGLFGYYYYFLWPEEYLAE